MPSLRERLPPDLRAAPTGPDPGAPPFTSLYLRHDEWAAEIANRTMHGVLHIGWIPDGINYMAAIRPFRHVNVYPAMLREIKRRWLSASSLREQNPVTERTVKNERSDNELHHRRADPR